MSGSGEMLRDLVKAAALLSAERQSCQASLLECLFK